MMKKTSIIYAPDGTPLKKLYCPKAKKWNQLVVDPGEARWRGCHECNEKVYDLDRISLDKSLNLFRSRYSKDCVHVSDNSQNVIFLIDQSAVIPVKEVSGSPIKIQTVYGKADIARGYAMGYWPDVRIIKPDPKLNAKVSVGQHPETGEIHYSHDYRTSFSMNEGDDPTVEGVQELHPFFSYYPYHRREPVAAYMVPKGLPNGTRVLVDDPIENIIGTTWNQGGGWKPDNVPGYVENNKVVLEPSKVKVSHAIG